MAIRIGSNSTSLTAQRQLSSSSAQLSSVFERLSSGSRINKASDDAAGLAIADSLNTKSRIYARGIKNVNDGISVISIADAALSALSDITTRIVELAEQSASGTYSNDQRGAMDREAQELAEEYSRISRSTSFNNIRLFDGSLQGLSIQAGEGESAVLASSLGGQMGTGAFNEGVAGPGGPSCRAVALGDLNMDGILDMVTGNQGSGFASVMLGNGDGSFVAQAPTTLVGGPAVDVKLGDMNGDGVLDIVSANSAGVSGAVLLGNGDGTFKPKLDYDLGGFADSISLGDVNGDDVLDIVGAKGNNAVVALGKGNGTFDAAKSYGVGTTALGIGLGDLNADGALDIVTANMGSDDVSILLGNGDGTFQAQSVLAGAVDPRSIAFGDLNGDGALDFMTANSGGGGSTSAFLGNGDGTFRTRIDTATSGTSNYVALGDLNGDSVLDMATANAGSHTASVLLGNGDGTFRAPSTYSTTWIPLSVALGDLDRDGVLDMVAADLAGSNTSVFIGKTRDGIAPILPFSLRTMADALQALMPVKDRLNTLAAQRGVLGAFEARLSTAAANLTSSVENFKNAESRIRDTDVAKDAAEMARLQILRNAGAAVLGQANQEPQIALRLLDTR